MGFDTVPLFLSLRTALCASGLAFLLGVLLARLFLYARGWVKWLTDLLFTLPLVLPPTVVGFYLLVGFGRGSPLGKLLAQMGISLIFTWEATVLAATVVAFPILYRAAKGAFEQVPVDQIWAARTLGMPEWRIFLRVLIPQAWPGVAAGTALAFARALGEFGATMMLAGNIPGRTRTIPMAIYFAVAAGDLRTAGIWTGMLTAVSCVALGLMQFYNGRQAAKSAGGGRGCA